MGYEEINEQVIDEYITFNSLYGIHCKKNFRNNCSIHLSIPFMGYYEIIFCIIQHSYYFQFPLWDTYGKAGMIVESYWSFQFPLWDTYIHKFYLVQLYTTFNSLYGIQRSWEHLKYKL